MRYPTLFKSDEHEEQYLAAYDALLTLWGVPVESHDIPTSFGMTRVNIAGDPDLPPLALLHGSAVNSTEWYRNVGPLSQHYCVYAPDLMNQTGLTVPDAPLTSREQCVDWLNEVLDALHVERVPLAGHSYGGWMATNYTLAVPERVERLVLLAPAPVFAPLNWRMFVRMMGVMVVPARSSFYGFFRWTTPMPINDPDPLVELFIAGIRTIKPQAMSIPVMGKFTDEELGGIACPTLLLIGEHEVTFDPRRAYERAQRVLPGIDASMIPGAGHLLPIDQAEVVNERILRFLSN